MARWTPLTCVNDVGSETLGSRIIALPQLRRYIKRAKRVDIYGASPGYQLVVEMAFSTVKRP